MYNIGTAVELDDGKVGTVIGYFEEVFYIIKLDVCFNIYIDAIVVHTDFVAEKGE